MQITLCLLTLNELAGCRHDVPQLPRGEFAEIYAIDGGSTDGTAEYLEEQGIRVYKQPFPGLNAAHIYAVEKCSTDAIIIFHPKGSIAPADALKFKNLFEDGYELVVASRNGPGGINEEDRKWLRPRKWLSMSLAAAAALVWRREGNMIWDVLHGFRGFTLNAFQRIQPLKEGLSIDIELVIRSYKKRIKRIEFPTQETSRIAGTTHFKILPTGRKLFIYVLKELVRND